MRGLAKRSAAFGDVGLIERPDPAAADGCVILRVAGCGVCGTDLHIFRNEYAVRPPVVMGHEVCGVVESVGEGVDPGLIGGRFVAETFYSTCMRCRHCRDGRTSLCRQRRSIGSHVDGAMAPRVAVPALNLHAPPEAMSDAAAALAEPVACVTNSLYGEGPHVEAGDRVLVVGPGAIGLIAAQVARACGGTATVRGTAKDRARLDLAERLGFAVSLAEEPVAEEAYDVTVECSGSGPGYADALRAADRGGRVAQMGLSGRDSTLPMDLVCYKELTLTSGFASNPRSWRRAMRLLHAGAIELEPLITAVLPLAGWREAFDRSFAADGVKFVFDPRMDNDG